MLDFINKVDDGNGNVSFEGFCSILTELHKETDTEAEFKNAFRAFYKDEEGEDNDNGDGGGGDGGDGGDDDGGGDGGDGVRYLAVSPQATYQQRR